VTRHFGHYNHHYVKHLASLLILYFCLLLGQNPSKKDNAVSSQIRITAAYSATFSHS